MWYLLSSAVKNAEKGNYAIGAFNVYNLEGIEAVVAAAEEERSPAILQVSTFLFFFCSINLSIRFRSLDNF